MAITGTITITDDATFMNDGSVMNLGTIVGKFVEHLSIPRCALSATAGGGSPIVAWDLTLGGMIYSSGPIAPVDSVNDFVTFPKLTNSDWLTATAHVTDALGQVVTITTVSETLPYWNPAITDFIVRRCDPNGILNEAGTTVQIISSGNIPTLFNGTERNRLTWTLYSRVVGAEVWGDPIKQTVVPVDLAWASTDVLGIGAYDAAGAYEFMLFSEDRFNTVVSIVSITTASVAMSWSRTGVGINKVWEQGALDVVGDIYEDGVKLSEKYAPFMPPSCRFWQTGNWTFTGPVSRDVPWSAQTMDVYDPNTSPHVIVPNLIEIQAPGMYRVSGAVAMNPTVSALPKFSIYKNGVSSSVVAWTTIDAGYAYTQTFSDEVRCVAGDYLQLWVECPQDLPIVGSGAPVYMNVTWISA